MRRRLQIAIAACLLLLAGSAAAALAYAPYLPALLAEGFPPLVGPAPGRVAAIAGAAPPRPIGNSARPALLPEADTLFLRDRGKALLVYRGGELLVEHYAPGIHADTPLNSYSMAKSLVGALVFKALAEGRIDSLEQTLGTLLPELAGSGVAGVSLAALLAMRSGIDFETATTPPDAEPHKAAMASAMTPFGPLARLHFLGLDAVAGDLAADPATAGAFSYQNVNTALLGAVLAAAYGRPLPDLLAEKLWQPAGAAPAAWLRPGGGDNVAAYCCIFATARDWVRIGAFLTANGRPDEPFLPAPLWRAFMGLDLDAETIARGHYGAHVWQDVLDRPGEPLQGPFTYLMGQNGQMLYLMPQHDLVVYRAGEGIALLHSTLYGAFNSAMR